MKTSIVLNRIALGALCATAAALSTDAYAQNFTLQNISSVSQQVKISDYGAAAESTYTGPYLATINGVQNIPVFCVDAFNNISANTSYNADLSQLVTNAAGSFNASINSNTGYYTGGLASALTPGDYNPSQLVAGTGLGSAQARADEVAWLAGNYTYATSFTNGISTNVADNFAAISLAIWDIVQNGGGGNYTNPSFAYNFTGTTTTDGSTITSLVSYYEGLAAGNYMTPQSNVIWVQAPTTDPNSFNGPTYTHDQEFMYVEPVPEPGIVVTSLSMVGMVGLGMVRGRRRSGRSLA